jgi:glycolate oxidase
MSLADAFREFVDPQYVIEDAETRKPFECDGLSMIREVPDLVVLPDNVEQLRQIIRICNDQEVPVVPRGAATGLTAGATASKGAVVVGLSRLDQILEIDPLARIARVQPGVRNLAISEAAAEHGLFYGPDPSSQIACSIGGNIAREIIRLGGDGLDSAGFDLLALMIGSEGLLGVVTEITVRLLPAPECAQVILAAFDDVQAAGDAVGAVISAGIIPAGLEMMDGPAIRAAEDFAHAGYPREAAAILLCELDGGIEETSANCDRVTQIFSERGATSIRVAESEAERALLWKGRKSAFPAVGRIAADYYCMDGTIPRGQLARVLTEIDRMSRDFGLGVANVFHAGDGNLHPLILFDAGKPGDTEKAEAFGGQILELCVEAGGCITGEHGVGVEKIRQMPAQFSDSEIAQFHAIKSAFDPHTQLNPGKVIPQLRYCQEYRSLKSRDARDPQA